jgi:hypothetical protein
MFWKPEGPTMGSTRRAAKRTNTRIQQAVDDVIFASFSSKYSRIEVYLKCFLVGRYFLEGGVF